MSSVNLDTLGINVDELYDIAGTEEFTQLVESLLEGKSESERTAIMDAIRAELDEAVIEYEDMLDGAKDDEDRAREMDDDMGEQRAEEEQDELKDMIDFLEDNAETFVTDAENEYLKTHYSTSEDLMLTTSDFEDGDNVIIEATSNLEEIFEDTSEEYKEGTDYNQDGIVNYTDYELFTQDQKTAMYDNYQDIFLTLDPGFTVTNTEFSGDKVVYTVSNGDKTITYEIQNISEGVHIFFDSTEENFISESTYKSWPAELQKMTYFGDSLNSVYENEHPISDTEKLKYVTTYDDAIAGIPEVATHFGITSETIIGKTEEYFDMLYAYYNDSSGTATIEEIWSDIILDMSSMSSQEKSDTILLLCMTLAMKADQEHTMVFLAGAGSNISAIENVLLEDGGPYSANEAMLVMFLETNLGAVGNYGGTTMWDPNNGKVLTYNGSGNLVVLDENFGTAEQMQEYLDLYNDTLALIGWATNNGTATEVSEALQKNIDAEESTGGAGTVMTQEYLDALGKAASKFHPDAGDHLLDGIDEKEFQQGVTAAIQAMLGVTGSIPVSEAGDFGDLSYYIDALIGYLTSGIKNAGDIAAGVVYALDKACPDLFEAMMIADPNLANTLRGIINSENETDTAPIEDALETLEDYEDDVEDAKKEAERAKEIEEEYGMTLEEYEAAVRDALIQIYGEDTIENIENMGSMMGMGAVVSLDYSSYDLNELQQQIEDL